MALNFGDRLATIVITATLTSAVWIVAGGSLIENATSASQREKTRPAEAQPSPSVAGADRSGLPELSSAPSPSERTGEALRIPVLNIRASDLTDTFAAGRDGGTRPHEAIDIMAPEGTTVVAAAPGTIEKLFVSDAGGKTIYVRSPDRRVIHYYAHLRDYAEGLREGQRIRRGQRLGTVGSTGNADPASPHLHFAIMETDAGSEWWEPAASVNPYPHLIGR